MDVVVLDAGPRLRGQLLQQAADGGRHLREQDKRDERPSRHLPGAVHGRATASVNQAGTKEGRLNAMEKLLKRGDGTAALLS